MIAGIVVQARMGSQRMPGKVLMELMGEPMLGRELERLGRTPGVDRLIVATTDTPADDALARYVEGRAGMGLWRGPEDDVLARFAGAAGAFGLDIVGRVTADCPLIDPDVVGAVLRAFRDTPGCDYASICRPRSYPHGFDVEFVSRRALDAAHAEATDPFDREHVLVHVFTRPERFRCINIEAEDRRWDGLRLTVDYPEDLEFVRAVYQALYPGNPAFGFAEIGALLAARPELLDINAAVPRHTTIMDAEQRGQARRAEGT